MTTQNTAELIPFRLARALTSKVLHALTSRDMEEIAEIQSGLEGMFEHYPIVSPTNTNNVLPFFTNILEGILQTWISSNERCVCTGCRAPGMSRANCAAANSQFDPEDLALGLDHQVRVRGVRAGFKVRGRVRTC